MFKLKDTVLFAAIALVMTGCFSMNRDTANNTANTAGANNNKGGTTGAAASPTPTPAASATPAPVAQNVNERVKFTKGKEGTTLKGEVTANGSSNYTLGAKAGQLMNITVTSGKKGVSFDLVDKTTGETLAENQTDWGESLASDGDYVIRVYSTKGGDTYALKVSVQDEGE